MISTFLFHTHLEQFELNPSHISELNHKTILIKKWNWDYEKAHSFQRHCLSLLDKIPHSKILICCSHPRVFTNGRGLQKPKKGQTLELVNFDASLAQRLPFPYYQIERGGGLTFHHPGQMIIYPIVRLNPKTLSLSKMINDLFDTAIEVLKEWGIQGATHENNLLGLWLGEKKLASMGIAIEKLSTFHGMALNFHNDLEMKLALRNLNPCGLRAETYTSVEELIDLKQKTLEEFSQNYLNRLNQHWRNSLPSN